MWVEKKYQRYQNIKSQKKKNTKSKPSMTTTPAKRRARGDARRAGRQQTNLYTKTCHYKCVMYNLYCFVTSTIKLSHELPNPKNLQFFLP